MEFKDLSISWQGTILVWFMVVSFTAIITMINLIPNMVGKFLLGMELSMLLALITILFAVCYVAIMFKLTGIFDKEDKTNHEQTKGIKKAN